MPGHKQNQESSVFSTRALLAILITLSVLLSVYTMPSGRSVRYEPSEGNPWMYDELIAPFSFPIEKDNEAFNQELDSLRRSFIPYFIIDEECGADVMSTFDKLFYDTLSSFLSMASYKSLKENFESLYDDGIIEVEDYEMLERNSQDHIRIYSGNTSSLRGKERIHLRKDAYKILSEAPATVSERHLLLDFHLEELVVPNLRYDAERSESELKAQEEQISGYSGMVVANQKIIDRGEIVDHDKFLMIKSYMDVMSGRTDTRDFRILTWSGNLLYVAILLLVLTFYLVTYRKDNIKDHSRLIFLIGTVTTFVIGTNLYIRFTSWSIFILPCTMLALMLRVFLDSRTSFTGYLTYLLICSISTPMPFEYLLLQIVAGLMAIYSVHELSQRSQIFKSVFIVFGSYCAVWLALQLIQLENIKDIQWQVFVYFAINAIVLLLTYPLILAIEKLFGFTSNVTLIELSNLNNPLLRQLMENAPGTFQHSMQVSTLASEAAKAIGASAQLVRTAALYHDIGKMSNPPFFTENQNGVNPHEKLSYLESARIITSHVTEGMRLAEKYGLPPAVTHFINTHHGNGMAKYFYIKYSNENPGKEVDKELFSYGGPEPDTKETAILMMADAVEASSRSLSEHTEEAIGNLVENIIDTQVSEGHFQECPITYKEISQIKAVFKDKLKTMYHTRISYPSLNK